MAARGRALLEQIERAQCPTPNIWWLGHSGFVFKYLKAIVYVDPLLSNARGRKSPPPFAARDVKHAGLVLCTHAGHLDAESVRAILGSSRHAKLVAPKAAGEQVHAAGIPYDRMVTTNSDLRVEYLDDRIYAVPSAHPALDWTPIGGYPYLGYLVRFGRCTIYHAGDGVRHEGLAAKLRPYNVTVALLPVSGPPRNMNVHEAAQLAQDISAKWVCPMHYGVFDDNAPAERFIVHMLGHRPAQRFKIFEIGERWAVPEESM